MSRLISIIMQAASSFCYVININLNFSSHIIQMNRETNISKKKSAHHWANFSIFILILDTRVCSIEFHCADHHCFVTSKEKGKDQDAINDHT